jgi:excisionase family DNA binding protein
MKEIAETADEVMNYKGLSVYLKLSQNTLRHKVMHDAIPFYKIGGAVRFSKKRIDAWLEEHLRDTKKKQIKLDFQGL